MLFDKDYLKVMRTGKRILKANNEYFTHQKEKDWEDFYRLGASITAIMLLGMLALLLFTGCAMSATIVDIHIIVNIESNGHTDAFNRHSGGVGLCQITNPVLTEYNRKWHTGWNMGDLYNPDLNILVCTWYLEDRIPQLLRHYHIKDTVNNRIWAYNAGIGNVKRGIMPRETRIYIEKYNRMMKGGR